MKGGDHFLFIPRLYWLYAALSLQLTLLVLLLGCMGTKFWVEQGESESFWEGGVLRYNEGNGDWEKKHYDQLRDIVCEEGGDTYDAYCSLFEDLYKAGLVFLTLELITLILAFIWFIGNVYRVVEREIYGRPVRIVLAGVTFLLHCTGLTVWVLITSAEFNADCTETMDSGKSNVVCITFGPVLGVLIGVLFFIQLLIECFALRHIVPEGDPPPDSNFHMRDNEALDSGSN